MGARRLLQTLRTQDNERVSEIHELFKQWIREDPETHGRFALAIVQSAMTSADTPDA